MRSFPIVRTSALLAMTAGLAGCPRHDPPPPPPRDPNVRLHVETAHALGVPTIDIRDQPDAGTTHVQIGGAQVNLPSREPDPPPATE